MISFNQELERKSCDQAKTSERRDNHSYRWRLHSFGVNLKISYFHHQSWLHYDRFEFPKVYQFIVTDFTYWLCPMLYTVDDVHDGGDRDGFPAIWVFVLGSNYPFVELSRHWIGMTFILLSITGQLSSWNFRFLLGSISRVQHCIDNPLDSMLTMKVLSFWNSFLMTKLLWHRTRNSQNASPTVMIL